MLDFIQSCFEIGFKRDYISELIQLVNYANIDGTNIVTMLVSVLIPIGLSLVALFWTLELLNKTIRFKEGGMGWEHVMMILVKLVLAVAVVKGAPGIITVATEVGDTILTSVGGVASDLSNIQFNQLWSELEEAGVVKQLIAVVQLLPMALISLVIAITIRIVIYGRAIKIIILSAFSPLPASTAFFEDYREIFKRFLQNYFSACLQGAVIILIIMLSKQLHATSILGTMDIQNVSDLSDIPGIFTRHLFINVTLLYCLIKSESWAGKIIGL